MKSCFVIQGYGRKTDYRDGRVLDLDASYAIIRDAVEAAGLDCIRADEIQHAGTIDLPMYEWLLTADLVVADLSTYNVNAVFELGVRYALRPHATIISSIAAERHVDHMQPNATVRRYGGRRPAPPPPSDVAQQDRIPVAAKPAPTPRPG